ncbi:MAG: hypothetical protein U0L62_07300 [Paludibacteraceae bacterium]|nr:hypothetical protein [Paludibacteraceae bacterium]
MKRISLFLTDIFICLFANGRVICDTTCHAPEDEFRNYAVVSPVGRSMVKHIEQALRLTTLDNKTIAVVDVFHFAIIPNMTIGCLNMSSQKVKIIYLSSFK